MPAQSGGTATVEFSEVPEIPTSENDSAPAVRLFRYSTPAVGSCGRWVEISSTSIGKLRSDRSIPTTTLVPGRAIVFGARWKSLYPHSIVDFGLEDAYAAKTAGMTSREDLPSALLTFTVGTLDAQGFPRVRVGAKWNLWRHRHGETSWSEVPAASVGGLAVEQGDSFFAGWRDKTTIYPMVAAQVRAQLAAPFPPTSERVSIQARALREILLDSRGWTVPQVPGDAARAHSSKAIQESVWRGTFQTLDLLCMGVTGRAGWKSAFERHLQLADFNVKLADERSRVHKLQNVLGHGVSAENSQDLYSAQQVKVYEHPKFYRGTQLTNVEWSLFFRKRPFLSFYTGYMQNIQMDTVDAERERTLCSSDRLEKIVEELADAGVFAETDLELMQEYMDLIEGLVQ